MTKYEQMLQLLNQNIERTKQVQKTLQDAVGAIRYALINELGLGFDEKLLTIQQEVKSTENNEKIRFENKDISELKHDPDGYLRCKFVIFFPKHPHTVEAGIELVIKLEEGDLQGRLGETDFNEKEFRARGNFHAALAFRAIKQLTQFIDEVFIS